MRRFVCILSLAVAVQTMAADRTLEVKLEGQVTHPGRRELPGDPRVADAAIAAWPTADAYVLGASLLRESLRVRQTGLKAGLVYDFGEVARRASNRGDNDVADVATRMALWMNSLPVTGRKVADLDPRGVEISPDANVPVENGDVLHYPQRPHTVRIVGAVAAACTVAFEPMRDARRYLADCPLSPVADKDIYFVIQPDGHVLELGRALWNRDEPQSLAPGAVIYIPIKVAATAGVDATMDREAAAYIATQVIP